MSGRRYSENSFGTEKTTVEDEEVIEAFISELESEEEAKRVLEEAQSSNVFKAWIKYDLAHPYDGDEFINCLTLGEDVTAKVNVAVEYSGRRKSYKGHVTQEATEIFDPEALIR